MSDILKDYAAITERWRMEREANLTTQRAELLDALRPLGVHEVEARYDGSGDDGTVEEIVTLPLTIEIDAALERRLADFAWAFAYHQHPGFENNDGGFGELTWYILADTITLNHADRYTACSHTVSEGL